MSPTIHREGPYRFFFYSNEKGEPPHVHVEAGDGEGKLWIQSAAFASHAGLSPKDLAKIVAIVKDHQADFLEAWHGYFGGKP